jgi:hypothetical protein
MSDLHRHFEGDFDGFRQFVIDAIATHTPKEDNQKLRATIPLLESVLKLIDHLKQTSVNEQTSAARDAEFRDIMNRVANQGLSLGNLKSLASILGLQGGRPGRPTRDYSTEYELRAMGKKWREVAALTFSAFRSMICPLPPRNSCGSLLPAPRRYT